MTKVVVRGAGSDVIRHLLNTGLQVIRSRKEEGGSEGEVAHC